MPGCTFQNKWLAEDQFKGWLKKSEENMNAAVCSICKKTIDITSMGKTALTSHMKSKKHQEQLQFKSDSKGTSLDSYLSSHTASKHSDNFTVSSSIASSSNPCSSSASMSAFCTKDETLSAEVWLCLKTVVSNYSFSSNNDTCYVLQQMFPDSVIASNITCGETKSMYLSCYGIAPYYTQMLENKLRNGPFVLLFDESLNRHMQKKQLDIHVRFWEDNNVNSRYYKSDFLGHACAVDLIKTFENKVEQSLCLTNILHLSMDGPNVNWSTFDKLQAKLDSEYTTKMVNVGSCGLHILHNAFKAGVNATNWEISHKLSSLYTLFDDVPARRADYELATKSTVFPLPFCSHRWVENVKVCERTIELLPNLQCYIDCVEKKKYKSPDTKSFHAVLVLCKDPFAKAKLSFIVCIAKCVEKFLKSYQTDKPMMPFLAKDLAEVMRSLMNRFIKKSVMDELSTDQKMITIDVVNTDNHTSPKNIDVGFVSDMELKSLIAQKKVSERQVLDFKIQCKVFLLKLVEKLKTKSPLSYTVVRNLSCLDPSEICKGNTDKCCDKFRRVLSTLENCKKVNVNDCDNLLDEYKKFVDEVKYDKDFKNFQKTEDRLDKLYFDKMNNNKEFSSLWNVIKLLLLISHGQATVERGFSVNKEVSEQNILENNLVARRIIKDSVKSIGGLRSVLITKELLTFARDARKKYQQHLDDVKADNEKKKKGEKRKEIEEEIDTIRKKMKMTESTISLLTKDADRAAERAEQLESFAHISKSNSLRHKAKEKQNELACIKSELDVKLQLLSNM